MRKAIVAALFVTAFATSMLAQSKPNFSGTWKLNVAKCDFGPLPAPDSRTDVITHNEPTIKIDVDSKGGQGDFTGTLNYTTDGKEVSNKMGPRDVKSTLGWEGSHLVVNSKLSINDAEITIKTVWTLSDDGKTLSQDAHINSPMGELDTKQVFEKQDAGAVTAKATAPPVVSAPAGSGPRPNFTGTWKLDVSKSDFGILPPDNSRTFVIDHSEPALKIAVSQDGADGKHDFTLSFTTDGKEAVNSYAGLEMKSTMGWESATLVANGKFKYQDQDVSVKELWQLSDDGKTLTQSAHYTSTMGEMDTKMVYAKGTQ
ncbi:MAG TPA: hypothetical protein VGP62_05255 [Bryobacteraceae bacterium]|jgi:hypothetical protein|nr:hypothetical protein [Bryobacteraceae bacterium]